ncbi:MAG: ribonuclease III [Lachnospiraceae bacterium]|nr:ribonuclease III [Lachnospiraceae bacterium]
MEQGIASGISILNNIKEQFSLKEMDVNSYSPLSLAFIGDSVFDLVVKTVIVGRANCPANVLHRRTSNIVKAESQSRMAQWYIDNNILSEEENNIFRRGRNAKSVTTAKNASIADYRRATGVEALIGYLYLMGRTDRLVELVKLGMEAVRTDA